MDSHNLDAAAVKELLEATERYRSFIRDSNEGIWRCDLDTPIDTALPVETQIEQIFARGYLAEANDAMARMYGFERAEEVVGARLVDMLDPAVKENHDYLAAFISNGYRLADAESAETDRHGNRKYFLNSLSGVLENGHVVRAWGTQRDVTGEKTRTQTLSDSEERLQALLAASTQTIWTTEGDGQLTWIAPSWETSTGQPVAEALGRGWLAMLHPDERDSSAIQFWRTALVQQSVVETTSRIRTREGGYRWYHVRAVPIRDASGQVREWIGATTDIDAQKREEQELILRRARAEFLAEANDLFVQSLDYEQTLRNLAKMAVPRLADWCGVDMIEPDGTMRRIAAEHLDPEMLRLAYDLQAKYPADPRAPVGAANVVRTGKTDWIADIADEVLVAGARTPEHLDLIRKLRLKSWICTPIRIRSGVAGVLTLVNGDDSPRFTESDVLLAEQLAARAGHAVENARLYEESVDANRAKDEFLALLSHELRTPLTSILGWASLLRLTNYDPDIVRSAGDAIENSSRLQATLIDDLLDISRIVTGKLNLHITAIDAVSAIESGVASARPGAAARRITIDIDAPETLTVSADANRFQQIVWNLMSNAVKFATEGSRIHVKLRAKDDSVELSVRDEGVGIDPAVLPRVFERFWQADSSTHRRHGGLGLGLAIVKYLAELHGGTVRAQSDGLGHGATFTVVLPSA